MSNPLSTYSLAVQCNRIAWSAMRSSVDAQGAQGGTSGTITLAERCAR
jgi:hypothetical protein